MDIKITAGGVYSGDGEEIPVGTVIKGLEGPPIGLNGRHEVVGEEKQFIANPSDPAAPSGAPYDVRETSPGWFQIYDASGAEVGKKLRKDDAEAFAALTDEEKADFLKDEA